MNKCWDAAGAGGDIPYTSIDGSRWYYFLFMMLKVLSFSRNARKNQPGIGILEPG
jgi:hypothetical protein